MRCTGYCTAESYDLPRLLQALAPSGAVSPFRDIVQVSSKEEGVKRELFYFSYGVVVCWGFSLEEEKAILRALREYEGQPLGKVELDEFSFAYGDRVKVEDDKILLPKKDPLLKLALSFGIGQSLKLSFFEETILRTTNHLKQIPKDLAEKGKISLSRKETSRKLGEVYLKRHYINLHSEILDTPDFFWDHADLEPPYRRAIHYLDVNKRVELLNRRLMLLHELFEILSNNLNYRHTTRLELIIILLIFIEILLSVLRDLT
jgi:uncharacterized Rmd1/YagE family protein